MKSLEYLLASGVQVALAYGDRDFRCPWLGAEALALQINWTGAAGFAAAGYESVHTNRTYDGGVVRQHSNLSFSRVFEAGHDVAAYRPETNFRIFNRAVSRRDIATGRVAVDGRFNDYSTDGPQSSRNITDILPASMPVLCYLWDVTGTCTQDQYEALANGTAVVEDFVVTSPAGGGGPVAGEGSP
ncbi:hypothetical protein LTR53_005219 [Teratosphaeriaceae sp. CCFEE 6253]|nr:hypothetical protein LTR53_005219 [Teratosphaeriaceae sp. CCFEE 6253]